MRKERIFKKAKQDLEPSVHGAGGGGVWVRTWTWGSSSWGEGRGGAWGVDFEKNKQESTRSKPTGLERLWRWEDRKQKPEGRAHWPVA